VIPFKDTLKTSFSAFEITPETWEVVAKDQSVWGSYIHSEAAACEASRELAVEQKRQTRKVRATCPLSGEHFLPSLSKNFQNPNWTHQSH
jgi:hypothetical protein